MGKKIVSLLVGSIILAGLVVIGAGNFGCGDSVENLTTTTTLPDTNPPTVVEVAPADGATGVARSSVVTARFSKDMDGSTINNTNFTLSGSYVTGNVTYDAATRTAIFTPSVPLADLTNYTATIFLSVKDTHGNSMRNDYTWSFSTTAYSASLLYEKGEGASGIDFGYSVSGAGDVNGDGKDDFIIGALFGGATNAGKAYVYSGADGSPLYEKEGEAGHNWFGYSVSGAGDVNGDGKADFIVGASHADPSGKTDAGKAYIYSGADGSLLYEKEGELAGDWFGNSVSGAGDVNGDGKDDFMIGAPYADPSGKSNAGKAYVYSGADGSPLYEKEGEVAGDEFGCSVSGAGDVNGNGRDDFMVGASHADPSGKNQAGKAYVYSGAVLLYEKEGEAINNYFGSSVSGAGDVNGDGIDDFIVGADIGGLAGKGKAYIYSGADGNLLYEKEGEATGDYFGYSVSGAGDVNGDGKDDFIIGALYADPSGKIDAGKAYVYSGADGSLIWSEEGESAGDNFGNSVSGLGDVNGDDKDDFIIGAFDAGTVNQGMAYVYISQ